MACIIVFFQSWGRICDVLPHREFVKDFPHLLKTEDQVMGCVDDGFENPL